MRLAKPTFIALGALALLATPAFAKNTRAQKTETEDTSSSCHSYRLGQDGDGISRQERPAGVAAGPGAFEEGEAGQVAEGLGHVDRAD